MCGRYSLFMDQDAIEIANIIEEVSREHPSVELKTGEIFPTNAAPVLLGGRNGLKADLQRWGFPHYTGKGVIINARAETAAEKSMFRDSLLNTRCIIPSTGFYEWKQDKSKQKFLFREPGSAVTYMAGFYREFNGEKRYVILTTAANDSMKEIHHRMPVILQKAQLEQWIDSREYALDFLKQIPPALERTAV